MGSSDKPVFLITGGCGFIGTNFILLARRYGWGEIINLDALTYAANPANLAALADDLDYQLVVGNIGDSTLVSQLLTEYQPTGIINFAAESHVDRSILDPSTFIETNVLGTQRLLDASLDYWRQLSPTQQQQFRFLHVSTDEVYGSLGPQDPAFTETTAYDPRSPYSASKAASDHLVSAYYHTYGLPTLSTNCSNNYGPYQFPEKLIPLMILNSLQQKPLPIYGDGSNIRDWLYVEDHCQGIYQVLNRGTIGDTYNIGGETELTNLQVVKTICTILDELKPLPQGSYQSLITFIQDRPGHDRRYAIDCHKIQTELGWSPKETFESGIRKTIQWYLAQSTWLAQVCSGEYQHWLSQNYQQRLAGGYI